MKLYLIRHAESYGNIKGKIISTTDFTLTEKGILQAKRLGERLKEELEGTPVKAYCSPLARARQTMEELLRGIGQADIGWGESAYLKEMDLGLLEGMSWEERKQRYPEIDLDKKLSLLQAPEGEAYQDVKKRCQAFTEAYLGEKKEAASVLLVSHGITLRVLTNLLLGRSDSDVNFLNWPENTAFTELKYQPEKDAYQVVCLNEYAHLRELKTKGYEEWGLFAEQNYLL